MEGEGLGVFAHFSFGVEVLAEIGDFLCVQVGAVAFPCGASFFKSFQNGVVAHACLFGKLVYSHEAEILGG
jgi:hypothetical protein